MRVSINSNSISTVKEIPIDGLNINIQAFIDEATRVYQCSRDIITAAVFATAGAAIGKKSMIQSGQYKNYPCLWLCVVAPSGSNKSAPVSAILRPLKNEDARNYDLYRGLMAEYSKKKGKDAPPDFKQIILSDATPEARNKVLSICPNGILLYRDEIKGFLDDIGRYNKSGEVSQLLSIFDADDITINRKSEAALLIERPFMGILGGIQPSVLPESFGSSTLMGNGFNQRWLFVYPDEAPPAQYTKERMNPDSLPAWSELIDSLIKMQPGETLVLSDGAEQVYAAYYDSIERKKEGESDYMSSIYAKLRIHVLRWALIAHYLGSASAELWIDADEMRYAVRCMDYFEETAKKVYADLTGGLMEKGTGLTEQELIALFYNSFGLKNKQALADMIGVSRPTVSRVVNAFPKLKLKTKNRQL